MAIIKKEKIIAWRMASGRTLCPDCFDQEPDDCVSVVTADDVAHDEVLICDGKTCPDRYIHGS